MSYHYFRSHHGTPSSTRLRMIAHLSEQHRAFVTAVYWEIYDYASRNSPRGSLNGIDYDEIAFSQEIECHAVQKIINVMITEKFITADNKISFWEKEQNCDEKGRLFGYKWQILRKEIFKRNNYTCQYCGTNGGKLECDHIKPIAHFGSNNKSNLVTACFKCNRSKRDKTISKWRQQNG